MVKEFLMSIFLDQPPGLLASWPPGQTPSPGRWGGSEEAGHCVGGAEGQEGEGGPRTGQHERPGRTQEGKAT